jgi:hypothetical protein
LGGTWTPPLATNVPATPPENVFTNAPLGDAGYFRVERE